MILAPLRGVTISCFREVFADVIREAGFAEAVTPFIPAQKGYDPLKDRELSVPHSPFPVPRSLKVTPQFIGKDPAVLRTCLARVKASGYDTADLNCGCPYPMVRSKGRGSGLLRTPEVFEAMLAAGCEAMGPGRFSVKARLGVERPDELLALMPIINRYPLRFLTVHARTARQMYGGTCDWTAYKAIEAVSKIPLVKNGDLPFHSSTSTSEFDSDVMVGRSFIVALGERRDIGLYLRRYIEASVAELSGEASVLGRLKELISYWKPLPSWHRRWNVIKLCRTVDELTSSLP